MKRGETVGYCVRELSNALRRGIEQGAGEKEKCTNLHGWVIGWLYDNSGRDVFQKDIEKQFGVRRSTMTAILQSMEKNGLIRRERVGSDGRLKRLALTEKALAIHEEHERRVCEFELALREGIPEREIAAFFATAQRLCANAEAIGRQRNGEETQE